MTAPRLLRLQHNNFTPATRTPWGGRKIVERFRDGADAAGGGIVGESWELSLDPQRPSRSIHDARTLIDHIEQDRVHWLGKSIAEGAVTSCLQLKIIDAKEALSLQVHPKWFEGGLAAHESGKFETWVVLDAEEGAGLYLGLKEEVDLDLFRQRVLHGEKVEDLLNFVEARPGDVFHIAGGTPHGIGAGVMLLEPQAVQPGATPVTYRFWDWQRRYNTHGQRDANGRARALNLERSIESIDWNARRGRAFVESCRQVPQPMVRFSEGRMDLLAQNEWFALECIQGTGALSIPPVNTLTAVLCLEGSAVLTSDTGESIALPRGGCAAVAAATGRLDVELSDAAKVYVLRERRDWLWRLPATRQPVEDA